MSLCSLQVTNNDMEHSRKLMYCFLDDYGPITSLRLGYFLFCHLQKQSLHSISLISNSRFILRLYHNSVDDNNQ